MSSHPVLHKDKALYAINNRLETPLGFNQSRFGIVSFDNTGQHICNTFQKLRLILMKVMPRLNVYREHAQHLL